MVTNKVAMKGGILVAITFCLFGCTEDTGPAIDRTVHLAGVVENKGGPGEGTLASYWKDSVYSALTGPEVASLVSCLYVDGSSVLIGGLKYDNNSPSKSVIWQDATEIVIEEAFGNPMIASRNSNLFGVWLSPTGWVYHKNGVSKPIIDTAYYFGPMAMALQGDDIYIAGYSAGRTISPTGTMIQHAQYWKNGQMIFREREVSNGLSIFTHRNDVYMAGVIYQPDGVSSIACYWKNGQRVDLTDGYEVAMAKSVFVTDTHVYAAGMVNDQAVYWKDGETIMLTTSGNNSMANSIFVQQADVHVGGYQNGYPAHWKNNVRQRIANQDKRGQVRFVVVGSN